MEIVNQNNNTDLLSLIKNKLNLYSNKLAEDNTLNVPFQRAEKEVNQTYQNLSGEFIGEYLTKSDYIQYAKSYFNRLVELKPKLIELAKEKWKSLKICQNILDMKGKVNN